MRVQLSGYSRSLGAVLARSALVALFALAALGSALHDALYYAVSQIASTAEYSYTVLVPLVVCLFISKRLNLRLRVPTEAPWAALITVVSALVLAWIGMRGALFWLQQFAFVLAAIAIFLSIVGPTIASTVRGDLLTLFLCIPIPNYLQQALSSELQLISSRLGTAMIRAMGISVYLEGNVIDLGTYQLQVAEACDGLRYLFPLLVIAVVLCHFIRGSFWKRVALVASAVPIAIASNGIRIAIIAFAADNWGVDLANGLLHAIQGWALFMVAVLVLLLEVRVLTAKGTISLGNLRAYSPPNSLGDGAGERRGGDVLLPLSLVLCAGLVFLFAGVTRVKRAPSNYHQFSHAALAEFPSTLAGRSSHRDILEKEYVDQLQLDDYLLSTFRATDSSPLNLYIAWYDSQQGGRSAHSPRSCLPAGGWHIETFDSVPVPGVTVEGTPLHVNRALIAMGNQRQLVYYWFQQRGRVLTNEYAVKWYLFVDAITRHRTDGALVRLVAPVPTPAAIPQADAELTRFAGEVAKVLPAYVPH